MRADLSGLIKNLHTMRENSLLENIEQSVCLSQKAYISLRKANMARKYELLSQEDEDDQKKETQTRKDEIDSVKCECTCIQEEEDDDDEEYDGAPISWTDIGITNKII